MIIEAKYEVLRRLGAGGMGEVYEARHLRLERRVALKFLLPEVAADHRLLQRFRNEARAAGALVHENIAAVYDMGVAADGAPYFVMEYLEGRDCAEVLDASGPLSPARAVQIVIQVCRGLAVAHAGGIVHRDLKPANLFVCRRADGSELVKILDFGIAKLQREHHPQLSSGAIFGTPYYMAPEHARGDHALDHRADIYALGVILYELMSGRRPYEGASVLQVLHHILTCQPAPLAELRRDVPNGLCEVVQRAMARSRDDRFASTLELQRALEPFALARPANGGSTGFDVTGRQSVTVLPATSTISGLAESRQLARRSYVRGRFAMGSRLFPPGLRWLVAASMTLLCGASIMRANPFKRDRAPILKPAVIASGQTNPQPSAADPVFGRSIDRPDNPAAANVAPPERRTAALPVSPRPAPPAPEPPRTGVKRPARPVKSPANDQPAETTAKRATTRADGVTHLRVDHTSPYE